jgi:hypothetical protein
MTTTSTTKTVEELRSMFARNGIPDQIVSENGPQFIAAELSVFVKNNGIIRSEPLNDLFKHSNKGCVLQNVTSQFEASWLRTKLDVLKADVRKRLED